MRKLTLFIFSFLFFPNVILSQWSEEVDSLISTANQMPNDTLKVARYGTLFEKLMFTDSKRALEYAKKENNLANELSYSKGIFASLLHFGTYHENIGQMDSARTFFLKSKNKAIEMNSPKMTLFINHALAGIEKKVGNYTNALNFHNENIGLYNLPESEQKDLKGFNKIGAEYLGIAEIYKEKGNYKLAVEHALKALRFFEEIKHTRRIGNSLAELGNIEYRRKNYQDAIDYGLRAIEIYKDHDYHEYWGLTSIDVGKSFMKLEKFDSATAHFNEALRLGREHQFLELEATALSQIGISNNAIKNHTESLDYLAKGYELHKKLESKINMVADLNAMAKTHFELSDYEKVIELTAQAKQVAEEIGALPELSESYLLESKAHEQLNGHKASLGSYKLHKKLNDSIYDLTSSQQIEELQTIYETEKKEQQLALQENEIVLLEEKQRAASLQNTLLIGGIIALISLFGLLYYGIRQKMKRNKLEKEKVDNELAFKKKELTTHAMHLAKKNEVLEAVKLKVKELKSSEGDELGYRQLIQTINFDQQDDKNWESFTQYFEQVHKDFSKTVKEKYPEITKNELRLMALLKMNLSSKEIAIILNISTSGVKKARNRLRKKLSINPEDSLEALIISM